MPHDLKVQDPLIVQKYLNMVLIWDNLDKDGDVGMSNPIGYQTVPAWSTSQLTTVCPTLSPNFMPHDCHVMKEW